MKLVASRAGSLFRVLESTPDLFHIPFTFRGHEMIRYFLVVLTENIGGFRSSNRVGMLKHT
jgi:hypothetical protein